MNNSNENEVEQFQVLRLVSCSFLNFIFVSSYLLNMIRVNCLDTKNCIKKK